jgi:putative endonuclease
MRDILGTFFVRNTLGKKGEDIALRFLREQGYVIVARNVTNPQGRRLGEIDIVAREKDTGCTVFIEVKTRASKEVPLCLSVLQEKLRRLTKIGEWYMKHAGLKGQPYRFDLIGIVSPPDGPPEITHMRSIFL